MSSNPVAQPDWAESIRFDVYQAKLAAATGDFSYFQASRVQWAANRKALLSANDIDPVIKKELGAINVASAETNDNAMKDLMNSLEDTTIPDDVPVNVQEQEWATAILQQNELAKKEVTDRMDAAAAEAIYVIGQLPVESRKTAANAYQVGVDLVMLAFKYLVGKIKEIYNYISDFLTKNWVALVNTYNAVKDWVLSTVDEIKKFFGIEDLELPKANGIVDVDNLNASQATNFLLRLVYSFLVPHDEIVASTNRIWDNYLTQYPNATSEEEPQNVSVSRKPRPEGDRDTDGKLMFVSWQVGSGAGSGRGRELIESLILSEQNSLAQSYAGGLRYNLVEMENHPRRTQQKSSVRSKEDKEQRSRHLRTQH